MDRVHKQKKLLLESNRVSPKGWCHLTSLHGITTRTMSSPSPPCELESHECLKNSLGYNNKIEIIYLKHVFTIKLHVVFRLK